MSQEEARQTDVEIAAADDADHFMAESGPAEADTATDSAGKQGKGGAKGKGAASAATTKNGAGKGKKAGGEGGAHAAASSSSANPTFPLARVSRIVKLDRDIETTSKDAIWTIAVATELFIKHLTDSAVARARLDGKKTVTYKELANAVESQGELFFLQDIIPQPVTLQKAFEQRRELDEENRARAVGLIIDEESEEEAAAEEEEEQEQEQTEAAAENMDTSIAEDGVPAVSKGEESLVEQSGKEAPKSKKGKAKKSKSAASKVTADDEGLIQEQS